MVSVENFYWIVYEKLLRPANIHANFFYPFGSTNTDDVKLQVFSSFVKNQGPYTPPWCTGKTHSVFFYDQEPIYDIQQTDLNIAHGLGTKWHKSVRLLANSEISSVKTEMLRKHKALDWYYFFHGFAALDWYRDARYLDDNYQITKPFLSLNHLVTGDRVYRILLTAKLMEKGLPIRGNVSLHASADQCCAEVLTNPKFSQTDTTRSIQNISKIGGGLFVDCDQVTADYSATLGHWEYKMFQSAFLHVINETVFYQQKLHLTEKIFKPIVARRPFVLVAAPGNLSYLKSYGFQTFDKWINESYDQEFNHERRLDLIAQEVEKICCMSDERRYHMYQDMHEVLEYNYQHFFSSFKNLIVNELVDNFERCIRQWNNGRVDDYSVIHRIDYDAVKTALLE